MSAPEPEPSKQIDLESDAAACCIKVETSSVETWDQYSDPKDGTPHSATANEARPPIVTCYHTKTLLFCSFLLLLVRHLLLLAMHLFLLAKESTRNAAALPTRLAKKHLLIGSKRFVRGVK